MPKDIKIGATIPLDVDDIKDAICLWVAEHYGIAVDPKTVVFDYKGEYDNAELCGARVELDRDALRALLNRAAAT